MDNYSEEVKCCDTPCKNIANKHNDHKNKCISCKGYMCNLCYERSVKRILINNFYKQYEGYCDMCIWWDMT